MKNLKNQSGITLVALVVTIIVLLILAGVSLNLVAGSEGILNKAVGAVDTNEDASAKEQASLALAEAKADFYEAKYVDYSLTETTNTFGKYLVANKAKYTIKGGTWEITETKVTLTVTKTGHVFEATITDNSVSDWAKVSTPGT